MNILLTGATGFVGGETALRLSKAGHLVRLLVRNAASPRAAQLASDCNGDLAVGDVSDARSLQVACRGIHAVVHLVGIISEAGNATFESIHVQGTRNLVGAARQQGVKRFVHMSALGSRPDAASRYHQTKWLAENAVTGAGFDWTIFRPSLIYGPGDHFVNLFARLIRRSPFVPVMGGGLAKFQPVSVGAVAAAFTGSLEIDSSKGRVFDLVGPDTLTLDEILDSIGRVLKCRRLHLHIPLPLARFQALALEFFCGRLLRRPPPLNRDQLVMLQEDNTGNFATATGLFSLQHPSFTAGITAYLRSS